MLSWIKSLLGIREREWVNPTKPLKGFRILETKKLSSGEIIHMQAIGRKGDHYIVIQRDPFDDTVTVYHDIINSISNEGRVFAYGQAPEMTFQLGFRIIDGTSTLLFCALQKELSINIGDQVRILLNNDEKVIFEITNKAQRIDKDDDGVVIGSLIPLSDDFLDLFIESGGASYGQYIKSDGEKMPWHLERNHGPDLLEMARGLVYVRENLLSAPPNP